MGHHRAWVRQCGRFYAPYKVHQKKEIISAGSRRFPDRLGDMDCHVASPAMMQIQPAIIIMP